MSSIEGRQEKYKTRPYASSRVRLIARWIGKSQFVLEETRALARGTILAQPNINSAVSREGFFEVNFYCQFCEVWPKKKL